METGRRLLDTTVTFSLEQNGTRPERVSRGLWASQPGSFFRWGHFTAMGPRVGFSGRGL